MYSRYYKKMQYFSLKIVVCKGYSNNVYCGQENVLETLRWPCWKQVCRMSWATTSAKKQSTCKGFLQSQPRQIVQVIPVGSCMYEQEEYQRCIVCTCRHYYDKFTKHGCFLDGVRYTGEENANLTVVLRAKRFTRYMQVCCNLHRGRDYAYIQKIFFPLYSPRKRRMRTPSITPKTPSNKKAKTFDTPDSTTDNTDKDMWLKAIESARLSIESTTIKDNDLPPKTSSTPGGTTINTTSDQTNRTSS